MHSELRAAQYSPSHTWTWLMTSLLLQDYLRVFALECAKLTPETGCFKSFTAASLGLLLGISEISTCYLLTGPLGDGKPFGFCHLEVPLLHPPLERAVQCPLLEVCVHDNNDLCSFLHKWYVSLTLV